MDRWRVVVASYVVGVALSASPSLAEDTVEALSNIAAAPEYSVTPPRDFPDVKLASAGTVGSQSVAVNPKNGNVFVAAYTDQGSCWVRTSSNGGQTWTAGKRLPYRLYYSCEAPTVLWAPDGVLYAAYISQVTLPDDGYGPFTYAWVDITFSKDNGLTWSPRFGGGILC